MTLDAFNERLYEVQAVGANAEEQVRRLTIAVEVLGAAVATLEQRIAELEAKPQPANDFDANQHGGIEGPSSFDQPTQRHTQIVDGVKTQTTRLT